MRLINPGHYGQKMPKWITRIELIDEVYLGHWESLPSGRDVKWSDDAIATVNSRIDAPLSVWDDFKDTAAARSGLTLSVCVARWGTSIRSMASPPPASGTYRILARATDSAGIRQPRTDEGDDRYDGRTGWHRVPVDVSTT